MTSPAPLRRRHFLQLSALSLAGASLGLAGCASAAKPAAAARKKIPVGVQLYSVRAACKQDFPGTLAAIARMGYAGVEFAGYWNRSAKEIRQMLDDTLGGIPRTPRLKQSGRTPVRRRGQPVE